MDKSEETRAHVIQLNSADSIFEWDVPGNRIYLSKGARSQLSLGDKTCLSMNEFGAHTPREERQDMMTSLSSFLRGAGGPTISFSHTFDRMPLFAHMTVVNRRRDGKVTRVIGTIHVLASCSPTDPRGDGDKFPGFWRLKPLDRLIRFDKRAMELLGAEKPDIAEITLGQLYMNLHPEDAVLFLNRYEPLLSEGRWEGGLSDSFRYRTASGKYLRFAVNAAVVEHDEEGRVVEMIGCMQIVPHEAASPGDKNEVENGSAFSVIAASEDGLWDWSVPDNQFHCSPCYLSMLGYTREEFPTEFDKVLELVHPDDLEKYMHMLQRVMHTTNFGKSFELTCRMLRADGEYALLLVRGYITHRDTEGRALRVVGLHTDISSSQNDWTRLEEQIRNDELTGLRSRAFLNMECERIEKSSMRPVSVIVLDLDGLKLVNDYLGHHAGDHLLRDLATLMRRVLRSTDCMARVGGDEFTVLLPACTGENALALANVLAGELERHNAESDNVPLLVSIGVASAESEENTLSDAISEADRNMLRNKHKRRPETHRILKEFIQSSEDVVVYPDKSRQL